MRALQVGGEHDQLKCGASAVCEVLCRRLQALAADAQTLHRSSIGRQRDSTLAYLELTIWCPRRRPATSLGAVKTKPRSTGGEALEPDSTVEIDHLERRPSEEARPQHLHSR